MAIATTAFFINYKVPYDINKCQNFVLLSTKTDDMDNTLIDNSTPELSMCETLKRCLNNEEINELRIATGYWDLRAMSLIYNELDAFLSRENSKLQLLIGKDPNVFANQQKDPKYKDASYPFDFIKTDIHNLELKDEYQRVVSMLLNYCDDTEQSKIEIRIFRKNEQDETQFLHSKCYIFSGRGTARGIIGSSNFTQKGLEGNAELNYLETDWMRIMTVDSGLETQKSHIHWFKEKWNISSPWNKIFLEEILKKSLLAVVLQQDKPLQITPYNVYIKFLQTVFGDVIDSDTDHNNGFIPQIDGFRKLQYQIHAVNQGYSIMKRHHGFILADVVGLGKTMVGLMVVKKFLNDIEKEGRSNNVLIITPPAIKKAWVDTINLFEKGGDKIGKYITFITTGSIGNLCDDDDEDNGDLLSISALPNEQNYGLIVIDESHKFRNSNTQMYQTLDNLIANIYPQPYMALLSATPQNNAPDDLKNQIFLFQREPQNTTLDSIDGGKLDSFFADKQRRFLVAKREKDYETIKNISVDIREKVLDYLLVRRTRTDIKTYYKDDAQDLKFPQIDGPKLLEYKMNDTLAQLFSDTMAIIAPMSGDEFTFTNEGLSYYRYRAIEYLASPELRKRYEKRNTTEGTSERLARIMQIMLVKRLESSFAAFKKSLNNLKRYTQNMLDMLADDCVFICPDINVNAELDYKEKSKKCGKKVTKEECYDDIRKIIARKKGNNYEYKRKDFENEYVTLLQSDMEKISDLCDRWATILYDPKLQVFLSRLESDIFSSQTNNPHGYDKPRLVIFTEAIDTLKQLKENIEGPTNHKVLAITAANRDENAELIRRNFDANAIPNEQRDDFDIIITTEVLAEGVNLHRSNVILNYDTPWNSTRLMQRIGRVNRIGSKEDFVRVYNFLPTAEGDSEIELVGKAHSKLQAFHALFGEDSQVFTTDEEVNSFGRDPETLKNIVDGEKSPHEQYIAELRQFKQNNAQLYNKIASETKLIGCAKASNNTEFACLVTSSSRKDGLKLVYRNGEMVDCSTLEMIKILQCKPDEKSVPISVNMTQMQQLAETAYTDFFTRMATAADGNKQRTKALKAKDNICKNANLDEETRKLLGRAAKFVRKGDRPLMRKLIKLDQLISDNEQNLFGIENTDINTFLKKELQALKNRVINDDDAPAELTLYMSNQN